MSNKVSVIIPARNELYLPQTVESVLGNARGECEAVVVLEGYTPDDWDVLVARYPNLHTIYHSEPRGMRPSINEAAASAISRGARYLAKFDAHVMVPEGWDMTLKADCDTDWVVVPRRKRLDPVTWGLQDVGKPDIDYHYLSFPDDPNDFGGPGLNGKVWYERCKARADIDIDDEMSSQGSGWFMHADYFTALELMDEASYGTFWNEFQEIGLKCWLSGGRVKVNKRTWYAHWHKGKAGRGYTLDHGLLRQGRNHTMKWLHNNAWTKQTLPFKTIIEHFWPVPTWPESWEELVYGGTKLNIFESHLGQRVKVAEYTTGPTTALTIHSAHYGPTGTELDVREVLQRKIINNSLDLNVINSELEVGNPFRGQKKRLTVVYSYNGDEQVTLTKDERDWLIIGQSARYVRPQSSIDSVLKAIEGTVFDPRAKSVLVDTDGSAIVQLSGESTVTPAASAGSAQQAAVVEAPVASGGKAGESPSATAYERAILADKPVLYAPDGSRNTLVPTTPVALIDHLVRRFAIPAHRLRGPMPIEVPTFHRNDLAQLFAELGFNHGAEVGVAEGNYSEVLLKANPNLHLLLVDPWHAYSGNPQNKSKEKNEYAYNETLRKTAPYPNVRLDMRYSMDAVRDVPDGSLDFVYVDAHHSYPFVMPDIILWAQKVRSGGIVAGDDIYTLNEKWGAGPMEAIYDYTRAMRINPWFLINAHKSVDFFFVKP